LIAETAAGRHCIINNNMSSYDASSLSVDMGSSCAAPVSSAATGS